MKTTFLYIVIAVGVLAFICNVTALYFNLNQSVSIKWLLTSIWISLTIIVILAEEIRRNYNVHKPPSLFEKPIKRTVNIFTIKKNERFIIYGMLLGCYIKEKDEEKLVCLGIVNNIQEKTIQIEIIKKYAASIKFEEIRNKDLKNIIIKPYVYQEILKKEI